MQDRRARSHSAPYAVTRRWPAVHFHTITLSNRLEFAAFRRFSELTTFAVAATIALYHLRILVARSLRSTYCETIFCESRFPAERFGRLVVFNNCFQAELGFGLENWRAVSAGLLIVLALAAFSVYAV